MKKFNDFSFGVITTLSIILCCKAFQYAGSTRTDMSALGGEVFTLALPLLLIQRKLKLDKRANLKLLQKIKQQRRTMNEQAQLINHLLAEKENTQSQHIVGVKNVVENPTE